MQELRERFRSFDPSFELRDVDALGDHIYDVRGYITYRNQYNAKIKRGWAGEVEMHGERFKMMQPVYVAPVQEP